MRAILVDWIVEVHLKFKLVTDTLYLCVQLIDRYVTRKAGLELDLGLSGLESGALSRLLSPVAGLVIPRAVGLF